MYQIPILQVTIPDWCDYKDKVIEEILDKNNLRKYGQNTTTFSYDECPLDNFSTFLEFVNPSLMKVSAEVEQKCGYPLYDITNIWYQTYDDTEFHGLHNHGALGWSAIFYAKFDKEQHRATTFYPPYCDIRGDHVEFTPDVSEGTLMIFPSWLNHQSLPSQSKVERAIISFNMFPIKDIMSGDLGRKH